PAGSLVSDPENKQVVPTGQARRDSVSRGVKTRSVTGVESRPVLEPTESLTAHAASSDTARQETKILIMRTPIVLSGRKVRTTPLPLSRESRARASALAVALVAARRLLRLVGPCRTDPTQPAP